jgi:hypothetical protein
MTQEIEVLKIISRIIFQLFVSNILDRVKKLPCPSKHIILFVLGQKTKTISYSPNGFSGFLTLKIKNIIAPINIAPTRIYTHKRLAG